MPILGEQRDAAQLTVTIVLYNSAEHLGACLASLRADMGAGLVRVVAVDNASPDDSAALFRSTLPGAPVVRAPRNLGFAGGCNLAWPLVDTRYWVLLNPDTVVPVRTMSRMVQWLDARPNVGASSPHLTGVDGSATSAARRFPSLGWSCFELSRLHLLLPRPIRGRLLLGPYLAGTSEVCADWVPGTAMFLRRDAVQQVGLLNESFFMYGEDIEYCWRLREAGWQVCLPADVTVAHKGRTSAERTWGPMQSAARVMEGWYRACAVTRGRPYARRLMALDGLALRVTTALPWHSDERRDRARAQAIEVSRLRREL